MRFGKPEKKPRARVIHPEVAEETRPVAPAEAVPEELIGEEKVVWDAGGGHNHDGTISRAVDHAKLANVTQDQHHKQKHVFATTGGLGADHTVEGLTAGQVLRASGAEEAAFAQLGFVDISGSISAAQHGTQASTAGSIADHTGTISANARLQAQKGGVAVGSPRPTFNFIQGANMLVTVTDTGSVIDVTVALAGIPAHNLLSTEHGDTLAATAARGALIYGNSTPRWARLTLGAAGTVLRSDGTDLAWSADGHNLLSARHADVTAATAVRGDLITAQGAAPTWSRLAKSATATHVLKAGAMEPGWAAVTFSELGGSLTDAQHGALSTSSSHQVGGDLTGTTASATVTKLQNKSVAAPANPTNNNQFLQFNGTSLVWATPASGVGNHNLLSATHPDTTPGTVARGDLMTGQGVTPTWSRLALGLSGQYLRSLGGDAVWGSITPGDVTFSGLTTGHVWKATGPTAASFGQLLHSQLGSVGPDDHHSKLHPILDSTHHSDTVTGTLAAGDLLYVNATPKLTRLPKGSDDQILKLTGGLPSWAAVNSVATSRALIQGWKREDIRNADTSDGEMNGFDGLRTGECMAYGGTLVGIAVALERDIDNGGAQPAASYTLTAYKSSNQGLSWSATTATVTLSAGAGNERRAYATGFSVSFAAGDLLTIFDRKGSLPAVANGCKANLIVVFS